MSGSQSVLHHLPTWASRWLGYRQLLSPTGPQPQSVVWIWSWIGAFSGLAVIQAVFQQAHYFVNKGVAPIVPSYGATAVLIYGVIDSPLAQPRNVFFGHFIGALIGVCVAKLFEHLPTEARYNELAWLAVSISCASTIVLMQITKTVHPPAGATAIIPILDKSLQHALGWYFIPVVLLSSVLSLAVALLTNNIQRRYPIYWVSPPAPVLPVDASGSANQGLPEKNPLEISTRERTHSGGSTPGQATGAATPVRVGVP
ncbi:HPP family protein [Ephemerocybe angulata]|uniref:HPP family protein n=1 Tax=Ephemerocybe angulata TaxID=980116 RepID=A0A8H6M6N0_9AGAR|nr:HPP family protein [Tulosesus angulatus]